MFTQALVIIFFLQDQSGWLVNMLLDALYRKIDCQEIIDKILTESAAELQAKTIHIACQTWNITRKRKSLVAIAIAGADRTVPW